MQVSTRSKRLLTGASVAGILLLGCTAMAQNTPRQSAPAAAGDLPADAVSELTAAVQELRNQVAQLSAQISELKAEQVATSTEMKALRHEISSDSNSSSQRSGLPSGDSNGPVPQAQESNVARLEEVQQLIDSKVTELSQTKVESGSKYRLRLSGILLFNVFDNRGAVDNQDFPQIATMQTPLTSGGSFGGSIRQSQISLEAFGPDVAGAHTSANLKMDFAGGFPDAPNGVAFGLARLRTGTFRMDWANTSIVAGQDSLFFAPLTPTSVTTTAVPPLAYAGNLWNWTPQVRIEQRIKVSDATSILLTGGILASMSGEVPRASYEYVPTWGEESGQPAYAGRIAWTRKLSGRDLTAGFGGYDGHQFWGFSRKVDSWATTLDLTVPFGKFFDLTGAFYRGRALGGLSGAIGQDVLISGPLNNPATVIEGIDSMGGWVQLKFKLKENFQVNGALGDDNPFSSELRQYPSTPTYYGELLTRNLSPFINFIYQPRSDVLFSVEFQRLQTSTLANGEASANHTDVTVGYIF